MCSQNFPKTALINIIDDLIKWPGIETTTEYLCKEGLLNSDTAAIVLSVDADKAKQILFEKLIAGLANISILVNTLEKFVNDLMLELESPNRCKNEIPIRLQRYKAFIQSSEYQMTDLQYIQQFCKSVFETLRTYVQDKDEMGPLNNAGSLEYLFRYLFTQFAREDILMIFFAVGLFCECDVKEILEKCPTKTSETFITKLIPHITDIDRMMEHSSTIKKRQQKYYEERAIYRNKIIGHWKYITENLCLDSIIDDLVEKEYITDASDILKKQRMEAVYFVLTTIVRKIGDRAGFNKLVEILNKDNKFIADRLSADYEVPNWSSQVYNVPVCINKLKMNETQLIKEMEPKEIVDDFLVGFICDLDDHEDICAFYSQRRKMATGLMQMVLNTVQKGSYPCLLEALKRTLEKEVYQDITEKLESSESPTSASKEEKNVSIESARQTLHTSHTDNLSKGGQMTLKIQCENQEQIEEIVKDRFPFIAKVLLYSLHAIAVQVYRGSIIVQLVSLFGDFKNKVEESIKNGGMGFLLQTLFNDQEIKDTLTPGEYIVDVTVEENNVNYSIEQDDDVKPKVYPSNIVTANRSLFIEELDPLSLLPAFEKRNVKCFIDLGLESISSRKARTVKFLDVLEADTAELIEVFLDILRKQKKSYVLKCLEMSTRFENIDVSLLTKNIVKFFSDVVEELNMKNLKNMCADRNILSDQIFERIQKKFPCNKNGRVAFVLKEIFHDGENAIFTLVECLYRSGNEPLVEKLLNGTQKKEMKDNDINTEQNKKDEILMSLLKLFEDEMIRDLKHEEIEVKEYPTDSSRKGLIFSGKYRILVENSGQECLLKTILLLDVGVSMEDEGMEGLKSTVADYLTAQEVINEHDDLTEHVAIVTFGRTPELKLHFRNDCNLVKHFTKYLSTSDEQSSLIPALELCKSLLMPELSKERPIIEMLRKLTFYPRIILVSDGRFYPNNFVSVNSLGASSDVEVNHEVIELCRYFKQRKVEIKCIPVGIYDKISIVEMVGRYPTDPLHFLARETGGLVVCKEFVEKLGSERLDRLNRLIAEELDELFEPSPLMKVAQKAVKNNITNVYKVMGMARDEGIEEVCPTALAGLLNQLRRRKNEEADDDDLYD